jgi:hypothetical protein
MVQEESSKKLGVSKNILESSSEIKNETTEISINLEQKFATAIQPTEDVSTEELIKYEVKIEGKTFCFVFLLFFQSILLEANDDLTNTKKRKLEVANTKQTRRKNLPRVADLPRLVSIYMSPQWLRREPYVVPNVTWNLLDNK